MNHSSTDSATTSSRESSRRTKVIILVGLTVLFIGILTLALQQSNQSAPSQTYQTEASEAGPEVIEGGYIEKDRWPFSARIYRADGDDLLPSCTAALIHPQWVLSAAHCGESREMDGYIPLEQANYRIFFPNSSNLAVDRPYEVEAIYFHPDYLATEIAQNNFFEYDVMLLRLSEPITNEQPVAIFNSTEEIEEGMEAIIIGGGLIGGSADRDNRSRAFRSLREAIMRVPSENEIDQTQFTMNDSMVSLYPPYTCFGDSGGPNLMWDDQNNQVSLFGVTSLIWSIPSERVPEWMKNDLQYMHPCTSDNLYTVFAQAAPIMPYPDPQQEDPYSNYQFIVDTLAFHNDTLPSETQTFQGKPFDALHCHVSQSGITDLNPIPGCVSDADQVYQIRNGCMQTCQDGFEDCRYGENGEYLGCQPEGSQPVQRGDRALTPTPTPESAPQDEQDDGEDRWFYYWDTECVCTDGERYETLRHIDDLNSPGRCNEQPENRLVCNREYPGVFEQNETFQTYWDQECVRTLQNADGTPVYDDNGNEIHEKVEGIYGKEACERLNQ